MGSAAQPNDEILRRLMVEYQAGSEAAFERLYAALSPVLRRYLTYSTREPARASDLTQETFLQMHRARRTYDPERPVLPWALAIARNIFLMDQRKRRRRIQWDFLETDPPAPQPAAHEEGLLQDVEGALAKVPEAQREAWVLHHVSGLSFQEIADLLGASAGSVRIRSSRAAARLREILQAAGIGGARS